eukprot:jgi/Mesvir1/18425/Mv14292-RA.1
MEPQAWQAAMTEEERNRVLSNILQELRNHQHNKAEDLTQVARRFEERHFQMSVSKEVYYQTIKRKLMQLKQRGATLVPGQALGLAPAQPLVGMPADGSTMQGGTSVPQSMPSVQPSGVVVQGASMQAAGMHRPATMGQIGDLTVKTIPIGQPQGMGAGGLNVQGAQLTTMQMIPPQQTQKLLLQQQKIQHVAAPGPPPGMSSAAQPGGMPAAPGTAGIAVPGSVSPADASEDAMWKRCEILRAKYGAVADKVIAYFENFLKKDASNPEIVNNVKRLLEILKFVRTAKRAEQAMLYTPADMIGFEKRMDQTTGVGPAATGTAAGGAAPQLSAGTDASDEDASDGGGLGGLVDPVQRLAEVLLTRSSSADAALLAAAAEDVWAVVAGVQGVASTCDDGDYGHRTGHYGQNVFSPERGAGRSLDGEGGEVADASVGHRGKDASVMGGMDGGRWQGGQPRSCPVHVSRPSIVCDASGRVDEGGHEVRPVPAGSGGVVAVTRSGHTSRPGGAPWSRLSANGGAERQVASWDVPGGISWDEDGADSDAYMASPGLVRPSLRVFVPAGYPGESVTWTLEASSPAYRLPVTASAISAFSLAARRLPRPVSVVGIAGVWDGVMREVVACMHVLESVTAVACHAGLDRSSIEASVRVYRACMLSCFVRSA